MRTNLLRLLPLLALFATGCVIEVEDDDDGWGDGGYAGSWSGTAGRAGTAGKAGASGAGGAAGAGGVAGAGGSAGASGEGGAAGGPGDQPAFVRFAHLAPNAGPVDVCLRPVGFTTSWNDAEYVFGPVFLDNAEKTGTDADRLDFYFPGVSTYFELSPPGQWEVRVVSALGDLVAIDCRSAFNEVADLTLDLTAGESLTVALSGDAATGETTAPPVPLAWVPYVEPAAEPAIPIAQVVNALSSGTEITLGTFDPVTQQAQPLFFSTALAASESSLTELPTEPLRYVFLSSPEPDTLVTPAPALEISAKPGEVWSFFAAGTGITEATVPLKPQAIACRNTPQGLGVTPSSLIAADCTYLNSKVPVGPTQPQPQPEPLPPVTK